MKRGDIVTVSLQGEYGKPRPALIVQTDKLPASYASVIICPITSTITALDFRISIEPDNENGLKARSQLMTDKIIGVPRAKIGKTIGRISQKDMTEVTAALAFLLGLNETTNS